MKGRYEIVDREHPTWRGMRFTSLDRALAEWRRSVPPERFYVLDRMTRCEAVTGSKVPGTAS